MWRCCCRHVHVCVDTSFSVMLNALNFCMPSLWNERVSSVLTKPLCMVQAAINGKSKVGLKMNIHSSKLSEVTNAEAALSFLGTQVAIAAERMEAGLILPCGRYALQVTTALPSAQGKQSPTVSPLLEEGYVAVGSCPHARRPFCSCKTAAAD